MTKKIDINKAIYDLVNHDDKLKKDLIGLGFKNLSNPLMLKTIGKKMSIRRGAKMVGIDNIEKKLEDLGAIIDNSILSYIAHEIDTNIRDLEGALSTAIAYAKSDGRIEVSMEDAIKGVGTRVKNQKKKLNIGDIQQAVANKYNIKLSDLKGKSLSLIHI